MASNRKNDIIEILENLDKQGFDYVKVPSGHWKITSPTGRKCQIAATPRNSRGVLNAVTRLKRIGYQPPSKQTKSKS